MITEHDTGPGRHRLETFADTQVIPAVEPVEQTEFRALFGTLPSISPLVPDAGEQLLAAIADERGFGKWLFRNLTFPRVALACLTAGVFVGLAIGWVLR